MAGGYDLEFLCEPPDVLKCLICHSVAREPLQHEECGKLFCRSCLEKYKKQSTRCPYCRGENAHYFRDARGNREIQELRVKCESSICCDWVGELRSLGVHLTSCPYSMVTCTNKCLTSARKEYTCLRKNLDQHLEKCPKRKFKCPYCQEEGTYEERTATHLKICPAVPTKCPNEGCIIELPASLISLHISTHCQYEVVKCKYNNVGCASEMLRKDLEEHENNDKLHLHMLMRSVAQLQRQVQEVELSHREVVAKLQEQVQTSVAELASARVELQEKKRDRCRIFKLTPFKLSNTPVSLPSFYTHPNGYHMCLEVYPRGNDDGQGTHVSVYVHMVKGNKDNELKWPFCGTVIITVLNQLEDKQHHTMELNLVSGDNMTVGESWGYSQFIAHKDLNRYGAQYLRDDTLYFRVSVKVSEDLYKPWLLA